jgi:very-short-patch-repair endonuclease
MVVDLALSGRVSPHKATNVDHRTHAMATSHSQQLKSSNPQISNDAHDWTDHPETSCMTAASRPVVLTRAKARALGIPLSDLLGHDFTRLFHDTYVPSVKVINLRLRASTIMKRLPAATHVSHHTAVRLWGGVAPDSADIHVSMASREARCRRAGVAAHLAAAAAQTTVYDGIPISTPVQSFLDLASVGATLVDLVVAGDGLVRANDLEPQDFVVAAEAFEGRNAKRARRAASLVRAGVDSPMETRIRLLIVFARLPEPHVNFILRIAGGKWRWRFDLCYPEYKLIIEYDGRQHAFDGEQWSHDLERREWLDQDGWRIIIVTAEGIYQEPLRTLQRMRSALEERGARVPKSFNQEWVRHFMIRA